MTRIIVWAAHLNAVRRNFQ